MMPVARPTAPASRGRARPRLGLLAVAAVAAVSVLGSSSTAGVFARGKRTRVLVQLRGYEAVLQKRKGKGPLALVPQLVFRPTPPPPVALDGLSGSTEGGLEQKELAGFPFTTANQASIDVGFPRIGSKVGISLDQPPQSAEDGPLPTGKLSLAQKVGAANGHLLLKSSGEWLASADADVRDLGGKLRTTLKSDLDWSADLEMSYPPARGVGATMTYGATQDGMRVKAQLDSSVFPAKKRKDLRADFTYTAENAAGKYSPRDFLHSAGATLSAGADDRHQLEVQADYNRRYAKVPIRGSIRASSRNGPLTLEASADFSRYRLRGITKYAEVAASQERVSKEGSDPARDLELKLGPVSAIATKKDGEKPRVRLGVAL